MHRIQEGREYYILPGGSMEDGETSEQTLVREIREEASVDVQITEKLGEVYNDWPNDQRTHRLYLCHITAGTVTLGGEELGRMTDRNRYILEWHPVKDLSALTLYPEGIRKILADQIK